MAFTVLPISLLAVTGAVCDWRTQRLPNWLTAPACLAGITWHVLAGGIAAGYGGASDGLWFALGGMAMGFLPLFLLWLMGGGGAGDAKFMAALGAWAGASWTLWILAISTVLLIIFTVAVWLTNLPRDPNSPDRNGKTTQHALRVGVPFGVPVAVATLAVLAIHCFAL